MEDLLKELENMATNVARTTFDDEGVQVSSEDIERWQRLFTLSSSQAQEAIQKYRSDLGRSRISDDLWNIVRHAKEGDGFDREAYEYFLQHHVSTKGSDIQRPSSASDSTSYVLKLEGPLATAEMVQEIAQLSQTPKVYKGAGEVGEALFCKIDNITRDSIVRWISSQHPNFRPIIVRLSKANKNLSDDNLGPVLGKDVTLPQYRLHNSHIKPLPAQNQYPVWYFFYGKLAESEILQTLLNDTPRYRKAYVQGGRIMTWGGKYGAMVDSHEGSIVDGSAHLISSKEEEENLQYFETDKYEVVRCVIHLEEEEERTVDGLVFRFSGQKEELS